jgi:CheY-like chemotaxis protein/phosphoribosyl 1,2-cyclic phosphodiesterase
LLVRFWGTRGSLAKPGPTTLRYGGNTSCVEVRTEDGTLFVLDCGTGVHNLGLMLAREYPVKGHLMITHTHWDHIQGLPFFGPLFVPGNEWDIYAPQGPGQRLEETLAGQMQYTYFPVTLAALGATIRYHDLIEQRLDIGSVRVSTHYLNHPALTLAYRIEAGGVTVVYVTDHEPHAQHQALASDSVPGAPPIHREDQRHVEFFAGADLLIHDSQYTAAEYPQKVGWGHSTVEYVVDMALAGRVKRTALFHHDPLRSDDALDELVQRCRERAAAGGGQSMDLFAAAEGMAIELPEAQDAVSLPPDREPVHSPSAADPSGALTVLLADKDQDVLRLLEVTLRPEGYRLLLARDGEEALRMALVERPDLIMVDWHMPGLQGPQVSRALRAESEPYFHSVPVVLITSHGSVEDMAAGFEAGVTDFLTKPFTPAHLRSRVRAWLLRSVAVLAAR